MTEIYRARWVLPISTAVVDDGAVAIDDRRILAVGPAQEVTRRFPDARVTDFGCAAILPGFVNAHSHLELTVMRGFLEREEHDFFAWLRKLTLARLAMSAEDLFVSATCGAVEAVRAGVTCVGDASSFAATAMKALRELGMRGIVYQESFGPDPNGAKENLQQLSDQIAELRSYENEVVRAGVSPHAVYTVSPLQLELISRLAVDEKLPLMMHAAESLAEELFMREGLGPFAEGLKNRGISWQAPGASTVQHLARHGVLQTKPLLAHCIRVDDADVETIKETTAGIAHCPKSNAKLGHGRAPFAKFLAAGARVGLGSDSVASNNTCDILEEARFATLLARLEPADTRESFSVGRPPDSQSVLLAATLGGARALGLEEQVGSLATGMQADLVVVGLNGPHQRPLHDPADALVFSSSGRDVVLTMVAGRIIYRDGCVNGVDESELRRRTEEIKLRTIIPGPSPGGRRESNSEFQTDAAA
jgi:5-methylthioadenosine/S-adenosylhomocysteine deaminase